MVETINSRACFDWLFVLWLQVHSSGPFVLLPSGGLLPSSGRREGGVVWLPSVCPSRHVEHDAQHRWWVEQFHTSWWLFKLTHLQHVSNNPSTCCFCPHTELVLVWPPVESVDIVKFRVSQAIFSRASSWNGERSCSCDVLLTPRRATGYLRHNSWNQTFTMIVGKIKVFICSNSPLKHLVC